MLARLNLSAIKKKSTALPKSVDPSSTTILTAIRHRRPIQRHIATMSETFTRPTRSLEGRVAIVSGAGAAGDGIGNGRASAILLAEAGCSVVCVDMKLDLAQRTVDMIHKDGHGKAVAVKANATVAEDCQNAVQTAVREYGRLDICKCCTVYN